MAEAVFFETDMQAEAAMKQQVIAMKRHAGWVEVAGKRFKMVLPKGCTGVLFCFESKKTARAYWGKDIDLLRAEPEKP